MRVNRIWLVTIVLFLLSARAESQRPRLIVTTDIGQDPDDTQSMVRLLHFANEFDIEGLIANADNNYKKEEAIIRTDIIYRLIDGYEAVEDNFRIHDENYPKADQLRKVVKQGISGNGTQVSFDEYVGAGKDTEGSDWIIEVVDRTDVRPVCVAVWGGAGDLAQALWKVQHTRNQEQVATFVQKLRVFFIGKQDSSNQWIIDHFPKMWLILALDRGGDKWESGYRGIFWGGDMRTTTKEWLHKHIIGSNPLADQYPDEAYTGGKERNPHMAMKEGDSPSFMYFINQGLNQPEHPQWGGWGGRYTWERDHFYRDAYDQYFDEQVHEVISSPRATIFRWCSDFQNAFIARSQWATADYLEANHRPIVEINRNGGSAPLFIEAKPGAHLILDASTSHDPDDDKFKFNWILYREAGTYQGDLDMDQMDQPILNVRIPPDASEGTIHIIASITDLGSPPLTSYKRCIIKIQ